VGRPRDSKDAAQEEELESTVGPAVAVVHLNDARNGFGSHHGGLEADAEEVQLVKELAGGLLVSPREV
jgi:hypothetical protein